MTPTFRKFYSLYVATENDDDGAPIPGTESICHFGDSNTILGIRIEGVLLLSEDEAQWQIDRWNETDSDMSHKPYPNRHTYSLYRPEMREAGTTPPLPGMTDRDIARASRLRFPADVGHVVGQGGVCWCGEYHLDAVPGDPVSLGPAIASDFNFGSGEGEQTAKTAKVGVTLDDLG